MSRRLRQRGFTLVELLIAVAVSALLAASAWPDTAQWLARQRLKAAAEHLATALNEGRFEAARRGVALHLAVDAQAACYALSALPGCGCAREQACQIKLGYLGDPAHVQVAGVLALSLAPVQQDVLPTAPLLLSSRGAPALQVSLTPLGRARICAAHGGWPGYPHC